MKLNMRFLLILSILFFISLSFVSAAADDNQTMSVENNIEDQIISDNIDEELSATNSGTFGDLQSMLWKAKDGDVITLDRDYYYTDGDRTNGLAVEKSITLDGNGHTLDGKNSARILFVKETTNNVVIKNVKFVNGNAGTGVAGAILWYGNGGTVDSCTFDNNVATNLGGAIYWKYNDGTITNCKFTNNVASSSGGAIRLEGNNYVVKDSTFDKNTATDKLGGAVCILGNNSKITNNVFTNNVAGRDGGAVDIEGAIVGQDGYPGYNNEITGNTFTNNKAVYGGGIGINGDNFTLKGNTFQKNHATELGGAVRIVGVKGKSGAVTGNTFTENYADQSGGAIYLVGNGTTIADNTFKSNKAVSISGGAINVHGDNTEIKNNEMDSNTAKGSGGATYLDGKNFKLQSNKINNNKADANAGAVYLTGASATITDNEITKNTAGSLAGAIQLKSDNAVLTNNQIVSNAANGGAGGAAYIEGTGITANKNTITDNKVTSSNVGGALRWIGNKATLTENTFKGNSAKTGFAVYGDGDNSQITYNTFANSQEGDKTLVWNGENNKISDNIYGDVRSTKITTSDLTVYYGKAADVIFTLTDGAGKALSGKTVNVNFNNKDSKLTTDSKGQVKVSTKGLAVGSYKATAKFDKDNDYDASQATATVTVKTTVDSKDLTATYGSAKYSATFLDSNGKALASGSQVTFTIDNTNYNAKVGSNGIATANIDKNPGNYNIKVTNTATGEIKTNKITIKQAPTQTTLTGAKDITVGEKLTLTATVNATAGKVTFKVNNEETTVDLKDGKATLSLDKLTEGKYTATATYKDSENRYSSSQASASFSVTKKAPSLDVKANNIEEGQDAVFDITANAQATGQVTLTIDKKDYKETLSKGKAKITVSNLTGGSYKYTVKYPGDNVFASQSVDGTLNVKSSEIIISAPNVVKYYDGGKQGLSAKVTDKQGNPIVGIKLVATINGGNYTRTTKDDGTINPFPLDLISGNYTVPIVFEGNDLFNPTQVTSNVTIKTTVFGNDVVKVFRNATNYTASFLDANGKKLTPQAPKVNININGVMYQRAVRADGSISFNLNLEQGTYILTTTNPVTGENVANTVTILPRIINNNNLTKYYKNASQYTFTLVGDDGKPIANEKASININGVFYNRTTNASGSATFQINLEPGTYILTVEYKECRVSNTVTVLNVIKTKNLVMTEGDKSKFTATILDGQGKPAAGLKFTFNINGVIYNRVSDENGSGGLTINLQAGKYIITTSYNGLNAANTVTVKPKT